MQFERNFRATQTQTPESGAVYRMRIFFHDTDWNSAFASSDQQQERTEDGDFGSTVYGDERILRDGTCGV
jgi:hypothetical protein